MSPGFSLYVRYILIVAALLAESSSANPLLAQEALILNDAGIVGSAVSETTAMENNPIAAPANIETVVENAEHAQEDTEIRPSPESKVAFGDWLGYNSTQSDTTWLAGGGFGMFSSESFPTLKIGKDSALMLGTGIHFLDGPVAPDMPPRLFDFQLAYHARKALSETLIFDIKLGIGVFSDFEGSARKGIRFPGHAVSYFEWYPQFVSVLGVEVLDRDDISLLPVGGVVWRPHEDFVFELVFPRPRVQVQLDADRAIYLGGELGGGTWAIERADATNDNATYRDLRIVLGIMEFNGDDDTALEIGWAFDRALEYRSGVSNYQPDDAFFLRFRAHY